MNSEPTTLRTALLAGIDAVDTAAWDHLVDPNDPFAEHAFLAALERSGCVGAPATGWVPRHLVVWDGERAVAAMPLYEKYDSYGEYIFDWGWAQAAQAAGLRYYPKLVSAVPFTPVSGRRLLLDAALSLAERERATTALLDGVAEVAEACDASSVHVLFSTAAEKETLFGYGFLPRDSYQFHWENHGWRDFDDYLSQLRATVRKQIKRERRQALAHGLRLVTLRGEEMTDRHWQAMWRFYSDTTDRKWGSPYLNRRAFTLFQETLGHRVLATLALADETPVAGALMFYRGTTLYGRYWGCARPLPAMHFELCYYRPIQWAIEQGLGRFEAGAQGEHKLKRGLLPATCHSAHWLRDPALAEAVARFLPRERLAIAGEMRLLNAHTPFRRG